MYKSFVKMHNMVASISMKRGRNTQHQKGVTEKVKAITIPFCSYALDYPIQNTGIISNRGGQ